MTRPLSRRTFLRGCLAGATVGIALPPLEAMLGARAAAQGRPDPFFGLFYWANGTPWHAGHGADQAAAGYPDLWTPPDVGAGYRRSELLAPLARHRVTAITGLEPHTDIPALPPGQGDGHMRGFMVTMTGDRIQPEGFDHGSHSLTALRPTLDQFVARHPAWYQSPPAFRSLEAGVSDARFHDYGHWNGISYNGPYSINLPIMRPRLLFDRLFVQQDERAEVDRRLVVLDAVLDDARHLRARLGSRDRERLDSHLEHVRDLQRRLDADVPACQIPAPPQDGGDLVAKARTMGELLALAVECRLTRVFSLMLTAPATTHVFSALGVPDGMHKTCHDGLWEQVRAITRHQMEAFAAFLDAFARPRPDGGTLLDDGLVYATTEYGEGWLHSVRELPVLIAGRAGGAFVDDTHVRLPGGNLSRAQLTAFTALGLDLPSFGWNGGETADVLPGLLA
ncbi:MAG: DUF1552 domain-containing protein [Myxococcales bacterium]|nr:DUF1552 domain-containing protein [Myxococcales bacterium]